MTYTIVGVTGHIDHGKTTLVAALSGVDTDSHPEEKRRGITIDLGFADFSIGEHQFALIDAPGHQRYIGNLLSGVSRVHIGLLLVAADQGIQAQTIEHAAILAAMGVEHLVVVISRCDLVAESRIEELSEELVFFLSESGFDHFPVLPISAKTGQGLDELKCALVERALPVGSSETEVGVRLPIDRAFRVEGRGWVAAGTLWSGQISVGDTLTLARTGEKLRVRGIEQHGTAVEQSAVRRRTAVNVVGNSGDLFRGDEFLSPGAAVASQRVVVQARSFAESPELRLPIDVQLHSATTSCTARLLSCERRGRGEMTQGQDCVVILECTQPIVMTSRQLVLLRLPYPIGSFAGGRLIGDLEFLRTHRLPRASIGRRGLRLGASEISESEFCEKLSSCSASDTVFSSQHASVWLAQLGEVNLADESGTLAHLAAFYQQPQQEIVEAFGSLTDAEKALAIGSSVTTLQFVEKVSRWQTHLLATERQHQQKLWLSRSSVVQHCEGYCSTGVAEFALRRAVKSGDFVMVGDQVAIASDETKLSKRQLARLEELVSSIQGLTAPPSGKELSAQLNCQPKELEALAKFAIHQGRLTQVASDLFFDPNALGALIEKIVRRIGDATATVSELREATELTRKHAVPLMEYCDRQSITIRTGNDRRLGPQGIRIAESNARC
ncbi:MAG TPA: selenocysteine-specific translation elongation factor [Planctomycetaceae bacterium]|nr:selenocysteine-specific translation elongation factor [Planctomycetaceae bacterium]